MRADLSGVLEEARSFGFLGPGPIDVQIDHAMAYVHAWRLLAEDVDDELDRPAGLPPSESSVRAALSDPCVAGSGREPGPSLPGSDDYLGRGSGWRGPERFVDLGSGGGVPALVLASVWTTSEAVLVEANRRRAGWLVDAVRALGLADRVAVECVRAEDFGRQARGCVMLVTARGFAAPAATAECAAPLLQVGGRLLVSEPPESDGARWNTSALSLLGLGGGRVVQLASGKAQYSLYWARQLSPCPDRYPRRVGVPEKRPLF